MILIADGGSTKADWIALDNNKEEVFRVRTLGLNPAVVAKEELLNRIENIFQLINIKESVEAIHFYGAGCGTAIPVKILHDVLKSIFINASINISEDMLAAVYASSSKSPAIVCILGTGSNSCYYDGNDMEMITPSLGYTIMDEASGNYFGKQLLKDYYYKQMPQKIAKSFEKEFNVDADHIKMNLYRKPNPNMYLATFAKFMFDYKDKKYIKKIIKKGFQEFFKYRILPYQKGTETPIYFIGSIAYYFIDILENVASKNNLIITDVIQRPIDNLVKFHMENDI
ncbi:MULTISPECIES: N-acetylglucosamine kinase [unclassified Tenacibaculum]|uniref:N-acetylglucosamine kinase n=1 Tax=unclassified Tenacibaculum TaxID=2635139 RepID=UPI001F415244|nr:MULTISPECIES: N-acetylglucosamine kinase [unclassified Tenacibaculum]MCF2876590.1 N-acetylglucosamine kinase [Tenacibaculum sp. Cn5-1]MCF2936741.1 N-acetylglucosamine kinase [Tenacibaculum sp. Cn5-34]MCG7512965.1 N-acetylglucosamine kinase [Tenacibaculum sp. Cn5-46]